MRDIILLIILVFILPISVFITCWPWRFYEWIRREKHPEYFEFYDAGMRIAKAASNRVEHETKYFNYHMIALTEGLREGECTEDYFRARSAELVEEQLQLAKWFEEQHTEADKLFREADFYAKENNLLWGVIY